MNLRRLPKWGVLLGLAALAAGVVWLHWRFVVTPLDYANKDFMSLWAGGKAVWRGLNPYDPAVWGALRAEYGSSWFPDPRAPFPLWTFLLTAPFALLPLPLAAAAWLTFVELLLAASLWLLLRQRRAWSPGDVAALVLGAFLSPATILVLINGQFTFVLLACLTLSVVYSRRGQPFCAGIFLVIILFKPNPFILLAPLLGLWLLWRRRWRTIAGTLIAAGILLGVTWLLEPGWLWDWLNVTAKTSVAEITPTLWGLAAEISGQAWALVGLALAAALSVGVGVVIFWRPALTETPLLSLALAASLLATPYTWTYEHALLYLPWAAWWAQQPAGWRGRLGWLGQTFLLPWLVFGLAMARVNDSFGFAVPLLALVVWLRQVWNAGRQPAGTN